MKKIVGTLLFLACFVSTRAQNIEVKWTEQFQYDNKLDGFFDYYIGTNNNFLYAKFSNLAFNPNKGNKKIKLLVFDKNTMQKVGEAKLLGYSKEKKKNSMEYYKTIVLDNMIYVLWTKSEDKLLEVYAESFDNKLKKLQELKKIYEISIGKKATDNLVILYNKKIGNKILLGKEYAVTKDEENLRFEYKLINEDFSLSASDQVTLPIIISKKRRRDQSYSDLVCSYELADDGNIYAQNMVKVSDEERKNLKKGEAARYPVIMQINTKTGKLKDFDVKFSKKNTFNFSTLITNNGVRLYGFFSDLDKDSKGNDTHGTFFLTLDNEDFTLRESKFSYFDKNFLDQLYAADKENQKRGSGIFKSKDAKKSDEESIDDNYVIERVIEDGKDILLFCSIMRNWSRTVCTTNSSGGSTCNTYYYCTKSNVTTFKLNSAGNIVWAKNIDRSMTYNRWNVYDLNVIKDNGSYYIVYGSAFQINAKKKNRRNSKSGKQLTDRLEYAVLNVSNGDFKKYEHQVNGFNTKKKDAKQVAADDIEVFDNKMYTECRKTKFKPGIWFSCLCPPVFYALSFNGNSRKGTGYMGVITPVK